MQSNSNHIEQKEMSDRQRNDSERQTDSIEQHYDSDLNLDDEGYDDDEEEDIANSSIGFGSDNGNNHLTQSGTQTALTKAKNRVHAKNTRLRKKNYIETLKDDIQAMMTLREDRDRNRKIAMDKYSEQAIARRKAISLWFHYRVTVERDREKWGAILDENFLCVMPITPYRSFPPAQVKEMRRKFTGVQAMIMDAQSLDVLVQTMIPPKTTANATRVKLTADVCDDVIWSEDTLMCKWKLCSENIVECGGQFEIQKQGMLLAQFNAENKLRSVDLTFDVMSFMQQLRRSIRAESFQVIPNIAYIAPSPIRCAPAGSQSPYSAESSSLSESTSPSQVGSVEAFGAFMASPDPRVVISSSSPFNLTFVNQCFQKVFKHNEDETALMSTQSVPIFQTLILLKDNTTEVIDQLIASLKEGLPHTVLLHCTTGGTRPVVYPCQCSFLPLYSKNELVQYLVVLHVIGAEDVQADDVSCVAPSATILEAEAAERSKYNSEVKKGQPAGSLNGSSNGVTDHASVSSDCQPYVASHKKQSQDGHFLSTSSFSHEDSFAAAAAAAAASSRPPRTTDFTQLAHVDRQAWSSASGLQLAYQNAATDRWMLDSAACLGSAGNDDGEGNKRHFTKPERGGNSSPEGSEMSMAHKSSRVGPSNSSVSGGDVSALTNSASGGSNNGVSQCGSGSGGGSPDGQGGGSCSLSPSDSPLLNDESSDILLGYSGENTPMVEEEPVYWAEGEKLLKKDEKDGIARIGDSSDSGMGGTGIAAGVVENGEHLPMK